MLRRYPIVFVVVCFTAGILLSRPIRLSWVVLLSVEGVLILAVWLMRKKKIIPLVILSLCAFLGGVIATKHYVYLPADHVKYTARLYRGETVWIKGVVISDVRLRNVNRGPKTSFELEVREFKTEEGWKKQSGRVLVNIYRPAAVSYGDELLIEGKIHRPFNYRKSSFSYRDYLWRKKIYYIFSVKKAATLTVLARHRASPWKEASLNLRERLGGILAAHLSPNEAGLMQAILLGDRTDIPRPITLLFVHTGTAHILAISGFNVGIIAAMIFLLLKTAPIGRRPQFAVTMALLVFYAFLTGSQSPVVRATIMAVVFFSSFLLERETDPFNTLALAALLILLVNPLGLYDLGFQMSFISVLAILLFYAPLMRWAGWFPVLIENRLLRWSTQSVVVSLAASFGVMGVVVYYFHIVTTPVTLLANLLMGPLMAVIMALGLGLLLAGWVLPAAAFVFADCLKLFLNAMVGVAYVFDRVPLAYFYVEEVSGWAVLGYYGMLAAGAAFGLRYKEMLRSSLQM